MLADAAPSILTGLAELASRLGLADEPDLEATATRVVEAPGRRPGWLLVFDNAEAAAYCEQTSLDLAGYLARFRTRRRELLARGTPADYPWTVATTWRLNLEQVEAGAPAAAELLRLCAFLAPDAIPLELLAAAPAELPATLAKVVGDGLAMDELVAALHRFSLMRRDRSGLAVHRLVQAVVRDSRTTGQARQWAERTVRLVLEALPGDPQDPGGWPRYAALLAHAQTAAAHARARNAALHVTAALLYQVGGYLWSRAELAAARVALEQTLAITAPAGGPGHPLAAAAMHLLGLVVRDLGDLDGARQRLELALVASQAAHGPGHPDTANALGDLGGVLEELGDLDGAYRHQERALAMFEAAYGPDDPRTAASLNNLGLVLEEQGDLAAAHRCYQAFARGLRPSGRR